VIALGVVLLIAMALSTTVKTATEGAAVAAGLDPDKSFSAAEFAATTFAAVQKDLPAKATDLPTIAPEVIADLATAGKKYGQDLGAGSYAIPVKLNGKVTAVDENFVTLEVAGMPAGQTVYIPLGPALNGGPIRDALGNVKFGDVPDQIAYQSVAQEIKKLVKADVLDPAKPATLNGKTIEVYGAWKSGGQKDTWIIQPVSIAAQ
jgi:predicted lipoprotein